VTGFEYETIAAAESRRLVVPNRISYGVYLEPVRFNGNLVVYAWRALTDTCTQHVADLPVEQLDQSLGASRVVRRPQTDASDIRWKIYRRA
jgi:hypothetical protein